MPKLVIIGAGGHAREALDIALACRRNGQDVEPLGFIDEDPAKHGQRVCGYPVLGDMSWLDASAPEDVQAVCAIGTPAAVRSLARRLQALGLEFATLVSPLAYVSPRAQVGRGVLLFPGAVVQPGAVIGNHVTLNLAASVSHDSVVSDYGNLSPGARLAGAVAVGEGALIGMGANVVQNRSIGKWSVIGAGATVIHDIPDFVTAVGVPARVVKRHAPTEEPHAPNGVPERASL